MRRERKISVLNVQPKEPHSFAARQSLGKTCSPCPKGRENFCLAENVLEEGFRSRNKFGMTFEAVLVLLVASLVMSGEAWAQCTTAPNCTTLGYTKTSNTGNCLKCPTGNYYFCPEKACVSSCSGYTLTEEQAQSQCGGSYRACRDNCSGDIVWKCAEEKCPTKKRTIYGNCKMQYLVGYAIFCQKGYYYCQVQSSGSCQEITGSRIYDTDFLDFGAYPDQTKAQERIRQLQNEIVNEICQTYNGNGSSSSGGGSGGNTGGDSGNTCNDRMPYPFNTYQTTSETGCNGSFYSSSHTICGKTIYICSNGVSVGYGNNKHCVYVSNVANPYYSARYDHDYTACKNANGTVNPNTNKANMCEYSCGGKEGFSTLAECEAYLKTMPDTCVSSFSCGPCVY